MCLLMSVVAIASSRRRAMARSVPPPQSPPPRRQLLLFIYRYRHDVIMLQFEHDVENKKSLSSADFGPKKWPSPPRASNAESELLKVQV